MEDRISKLERFAGQARIELRAIDVRLTKIEVRLEQTATRSDLHEMSASMIKWTVGTAAALGAAAITVMTFVLNNAVPKATSASPAPIIVTVPQSATSSPAVPVTQPKKP